MLDVEGDHIFLPTHKSLVLVSLAQGAQEEEEEGSRTGWQAGWHTAPQWSCQLSHSSNVCCVTQHSQGPPCPLTPALVQIHPAP